MSEQRAIEYMNNAIESAQDAGHTPKERAQFLVALAQAELALELLKEVRATQSSNEAVANELNTLNQVLSALAEVLPRLEGGR